jgi:ribosomal-protein-alanine N-acetyltransferase
VTAITRPATVAELAWIASPATHAQVVGSSSDLTAMLEAEPWRVRVTERGEAIILGRWRAHLGDCAVLGLWCSPRRVPVIVTDLLEVAREQGFDRLVGPLVPERGARPYLDAGLRVIERVIVMRLEKPERVQLPAVPRGFTVREADGADIDAMLRLDAASFDAFWHYDREMLTRLTGAERVAVGVLEGRSVGYTLSTLRAGDGSLGRLAVAPDHRRRGIGRTLAEEAVRWLASSGAVRVTLSTQEDNMASRGLYHSIGFRETGDVLVACASGALNAPDGNGS